MNGDAHVWRRFNVSTPQKLPLATTNCADNYLKSFESLKHLGSMLTTVAEPFLYEKCALLKTNIKWLVTPLLGLMLC